MNSSSIGQPTESSRLSRERVLSTALKIIDEDGVEGLSMRGLGRVLDCDPMSLYHYAANKTALLDSVAEMVISELKIDTNDMDWAGQLRSVARDFRQLALDHPHVVPLLVTRALATPLGLRPLGTLRPLEASLELLTRAGFTAIDALYVYRYFFGFLYGHILHELQELVVNHEESDALLRLGLQRLPVREFPLMRSLAPVLADYDGPAELERGVGILLAGLESQLLPKIASPTGAARD